MNNFSDLKAGEKSHQLTLARHEVTGSFPQQETFGWVAQIRRCSSSIPANITKGCVVRGNGALHRFFQIAMGPAGELEYYLFLAREHSFSSRPDHELLRTRVEEGEAHARLTHTKNGLRTIPVEGAEC
jgi:four helix bundle protein